MNKKTVKKGLFPYVFLFIFIITCLLIFNMFNTQINEMSYDEFISELNNEKVTELNITPKTRTETYEITGKLKGYDENEIFTLSLPKSDEFLSKITEATDNQDIKLNVTKVQ